MSTVRPGNCLGLQHHRNTWYINGPLYALVIRKASIIDIKKALVWKHRGFSYSTD
jgi:hypothetical protein